MAIVRSGLALKIVMLIASMITLSLLISGTYSYHAIVEDLEHRMGDNLQKVAATAALMIPGELHEKIYFDYLEGKTGIEKSKAFKNLQKTLKTIKTVNQLSSDVYTISEATWTKEPSIVFVSMAADKPYIGNGMPLNPIAIPTFKSGKVTSTKLYSDSEGTWISAFAPIKTKNGEVVGVLELDYSAEAEIAAARQELFYNIGIPGFLSLFLSTFLGLIFGRGLAQPITKLAEAVKKVSQGDFNQKVNFDQSTEVQTLSDSFNAMTSDLMQQRNEIENYSKNLEKMVETRTNELRERDKMVHHSSKLASIGQLAAGVAHEINNPLQIIFSNFEMIKLEHKKIDQEVKFSKRYSSIETSVSRIRSIVNGLRVYARDDQDDRTEEMYPDDIIKSSVDMVSQIYKVKAIKIDHDLRAPEIAINGNQGHFYQIIMNLVTNAGDALEGQEGGEIQITSSTAEDSVLIEIKDNGPGIPDEIQNRIFDQFFTTKPVGKGTGLGLGIVKAFTEKMGGTIALKSSPGQGTTFVLTFPRVEASDANPIETDLVQNFTPKMTNVLVVDDEPDLRELTASFLEDLGYTVTTAENGQVAKDIIKANDSPFDIILTDMQMPEVSGLELAEAAKKTSPSTLVFLVTGEVGINHTHKAESSPYIDGFIQKPFSLDTLKQTLYDTEKENAA